MKTPLFFGFAAAFSLPLIGADSPAAPPASAQSSAVSATVQPPERLEEMLGPIALYPDALVALILPASTVPSDIVLAARYLQDGGSVDDLDKQPWEDSVRALARYPDIIQWMDKNLAWTKQLGEAFIAQPGDVMNAMQRLRTKARENGSLVDTPQQKVIVEEENIIIAPAEPDVIYVPYYDPTVVYLQYARPNPGPYITFGLGYSTGYWLGYDFDWRYRRVWTVDPYYRQRYWQDRHRYYYWHRPDSPRRPDYSGDPHLNPWRPRPGSIRPSRAAGDHRPQRTDVYKPAPFPRDVPRNPDAPDTRNRPPTGGNGPIRGEPRGNRPPQIQPRPIQSSSEISQEPSGAIFPSNSLQPTTPAMSTTTPPQVGERRRPPQGDRDRNISRPENSTPRPPRDQSRQQPPTRPDQPRVEQVPPTGRTGLQSSRSNGESRPDFQRPDRSAPSQSRPAPMPPPAASSAPAPDRRPSDDRREPQEREQR